MSAHFWRCFLNLVVLWKSVIWFATSLVCMMTINAFYSILFYSRF